jgi:hypothetical protein
MIFSICKAKYIEHTNIFPEFPKTHKDRYATIIELEESILKNENRVKELKTAMQYTLTREGHGNRTQSHVLYLGASQDQEESGDEGESVSMQHGCRCCAGVKVCSHFPDELRGPHTELIRKEQYKNSLMAPITLEYYISSNIKIHRISTSVKQS